MPFYIITHSLELYLKLTYLFPVVQIALAPVELFYWLLCGNYKKCRE